VLQIGAELYGEPGIAGDREVLALLLSSLAAVGARDLHLDLGHVGVYRALAAGSGAAANGEDSALFAAVSCKDLPTVRELTTRLPGAWRDALTALPGLYGPAAEVLDRARAQLPDTPPIRNALAALSAVIDGIGPEIDALHIDLADLRGYHYQNGVIFSVFTAGESNAIGNGGRYDGIGRSFGRSRPATGFTLDLRQLAGVLLRARPAA
jgi:ATP phosphoribosyltransferase regulatory subunit